MWKGTNRWECTTSRLIFHTLSVQLQDKGIDKTLFQVQAAGVYTKSEAVLRWQATIAAQLLYDYIRSGLSKCKARKRYDVILTNNRQTQGETTASAQQPTDGRSPPRVMVLFKCVWNFRLQCYQSEVLYSPYLDYTAFCITRKKTVSQHVKFSHFCNIYEIEEKRFWKNALKYSNQTKNATGVLSKRTKLMFYM